jgi:hypothetical protein
MEVNTSKTMTQLEIEKLNEYLEGFVATFKRGNSEEIDGRDKYAMAAMTGLLSNPTTKVWDIDNIVEKSYQFAEAMLKQRKNK